MTYLKGIPAAALMLLAASCLTAWATDYSDYTTPDTLVDALAQGDLASRNLARQLLPREEPRIRSRAGNRAAQGGCGPPKRGRSFRGWP